MRVRDVLMLALAAAGVLAYRDATSTPAAPPPATASAAATPTLPGGTAQRPAPRSGRDLVANLLGDSLLQGPCTRCVHEVDALVVTLPDPVRSTLDWAYDAGLEAVHRAHEQAGFVLDRFHLPWAAGAAPDGAPPGEPGVLLFRSANADTLRLRLVYLVGELPTSGVHKAALHAALRDGAGVVRDLATAYGARHADGPIRVVGPALSGSSFSLAVALRGALADESVRRVWRDAAVVSGTATSRSNQQVLTWRDSTSSSSFAAMVYPDETLGRFQHAVLQRTLGFAAEDIAMLRESNTTYGRAAADGAPAAPSDDAGAVLQVPFSMSIAVLRGELSRRAAGRPLPAVPLGGQQPEERVALDLTPTGVTTDHPAATSRLAAPLMDWMLDEIAQNLAAHRVRAVGIMATDARDVLFLGSELRQRFRDVQLFTYGASGLFARADRSEWLQGMLVVSNYPLNMETQWWTGSRVPPSLLAFGSEIGVGVYNATLAQLGADGWMIDARSPFRGASPPPYWVMAVGRGTILPVAVITGPLDTLYRPALAASAGAGAPGLLRPARTRGITQPFLFFMAGVVVLWSLVALERREQAEPHRPISPRTFRWLLGGWSGSLGMGHGWGLERQHAQYATLRFAGVAALAIPPGLILAHRARHAEHPWAAVVLGVSLLLFAAAVLFALHTAWRSFEVGQRRMEANTAELPTTGETPRATAPGPAEEAEPRPPSLHRAAESGAIVISVGLSALFVVLAAVLTAQIVLRSVSGPDARLWEELFFTRATALGSGLSPFLPFLALAGIVTAWTTWHLYRVRRLRAVPTFEPAQRLAEDADFRHVRACARDLTSGGIPQSIRAIRLRLTSLAVDRWGAAMLLVMIALSVWLLPEFTFTFERMVLPAVPFARGRSAFDILLTFGILASIWAVLVGLYRLVTVWMALRRLLGELASTRLLDAFRRLPAPVARLTRLTPWDIPSDDIIHSAINEEWRELERLSEVAGEKLPAGATSDCGRAIASRAITAPALDDLVEARRRGGSLLLLLRHLHRAWDEVPPPDRPGPDGKPAPRTETQQWLGQLEECVAVYAVDYVEWVLGHLRHLAAFVVTAVVLAVVLVSSYPFRPQALVKAIVFGLLVATAAALLTVLYQLNRDELASNIQKTDVGRVTWDLGFLLNIALFVLVPLLTLVSAGVPEVRGFLFSWVAPTLRTFSGG